ncbi:MAG: reverse transcriptase domain-containing protein, partial [Sphaerospermopsis kisseleviana]
MVTNAKNHCNKKFVLNLDIKDFFPTITQQRIRGVMMSPPYNLPSQIATTISHICCYEGKLPQGAPTSPIISNIVCAKLDSELRLLAKQNKCFYTRYADDITFSTIVKNF